MVSKKSVALQPFVGAGLLCFFALVSHTQGQTPPQTDGAPLSTQTDEEESQQSSLPGSLFEAPILNHHLHMAVFKPEKDPGLAAVVHDHREGDADPFSDFTTTMPAFLQPRVYYYRLDATSLFHDQRDQRKYVGTKPGNALQVASEKDEKEIVLWLREYYRIVSLDYRIDGEACMESHEARSESYRQFSRWPLLALESAQPEGECQIYFRADSPIFNVAQIVPQEPLSFLTVEKNEQLVYFAFLLVLAVLFFYNLVLWIVIRQAIFGTYLLLLVSTLAYMYYMMGINYVTGSHPVIDKLTVSFVSLWLISIIPFFFEAVPESKGSLIHKILLGVFYSYLAYGVVAFFFFHYMDAMLPFYLYLPLVHLSVLALSAYYAWKGIRSARLFFFAYAVYLMLMMTSTVVDVSMIGPEYYQYVVYLQQGAVLSEMVLFSLLLSDRFIQFQREKQQADAELIKAKEESLQEMQELDRLKDRFLANTSHELRTPIHGIMGLADRLESDLTSAEARHDAVLIQQTAKRLSRLIDDLLDFSRTKSHELPIRPQPINVHKVLENLISLHREQASRKGLEFVLQTMANDPGHTGSIQKADKFPPLLVDPDRFEQIVHNLISNAIRHATEDSQIEISLSTESPAATGHHTTGGENQSSPHAKPGFAILSVYNAGPSIPLAHREEIFRPFTQTESRPEGLGLGLAIVREMTRLHGGDAYVLDSAQGVRMAVRLPLAEMNEGHEMHEGHEALQNGKGFGEAATATGSAPVPAGAAEDQAQPTAVTNRNDALRILVVDDDPISQDLLSRMLDKQGFSVQVVDTAEKALEIYQSDARTNPSGYPEPEVDQSRESTRPFDIAIIDVMLPGISGLELVREIRQHKPHRELPVLVITARSRPEYMTEAMNAGATEFLARPFEKEEILVRVSAMADRIRLGQRAENLGRNLGRQFKEEIETIYRNLHDHIGAKLVELKIRLDSLRLGLNGDPHSMGRAELIQQSLDSALQILQSRIQDIDTISSLLQNFTEGLHLFLQQQYRPSGRPVAVQISDEFMSALDRDKSEVHASSLFPIIREVVTNDLKYGEYESHWDFDLSENNLLISFFAFTRYGNNHADLSGVAAARTGMGIGTSNIQHRVEEAGGSIHFHIDSENRYNLTISVPL